MDYLVHCGCGHDLSYHGEQGCKGLRGGCRCRRTTLEALDSAIDIARVRPWSGDLREDRTPEAG
jgi:hypothetical protein